MLTIDKRTHNLLENYVLITFFMFTKENWACCCMLHVNYVNRYVVLVVINIFCRENEKHAFAD